MAHGGSPLTDSAEKNFVELVELVKLSRPGTLWTHFRTISDRSQHFCSWRANCCFLSYYIIAVISKVLYMVLSRKRSSRHCSLESWSPTNYSRMCGQLSMFRILSVHFPDSGITGNDSNDGNNTRLWSLQTSAYNSHQFSSLFNSFQPIAPSHQPDLAPDLPRALQKPLAGEKLIRLGVTLHPFILSWAGELLLMFIYVSLCIYVCMCDVFRPALTSMSQTSYW